MTTMGRRAGILTTRSEGMHRSGARNGLHRHPVIGLTLLPLCCLQGLMAIALAQTASDFPCPGNCVLISDYQHADSALQYSRSLSTGTTATDGRVPIWRDRYAMRLTRDGDARIVFDQHGQAHRFEPQPDGSFRAVDGGAGTLHLENGVHHWVDAQQTETLFHGSYPVQLQFPDDQRLHLSYRDGTLAAIRDDDGRQILLDRLADSSTRIELPDGRVLTVEQPACETPTPEQDAECDAQDPSHSAFDDSALPAGARRLDARPGPCQSYFIEFYGTERGDQIERGISLLAPYNQMLLTNRSFPIVDFIDGTELIAVRSRDLSSPSFNNPQDPLALYDRLLRDGSEIESRFLEPLRENGFISHTEQGRTTTIQDNPAQSMSLHVLVQQGMTSLSHWQQIDRARAELQQRYGISLEIVLLP